MGRESGLVVSMNLCALGDQRFFFSKAVNEYPAVVIPRCGPASPFKGQLSTKSNAFCIDSSRSLTKQYLIRDHLMFHYNRILSAKAAVDCSVPRSSLSSIKLADQQRRENLKKKIARYEKEMSVGKSASRSSSRESGRLLSTSFGKSPLEVEDKDNLFSCAEHTPYLSRALSPYGELGLLHSSPVKRARKHSRNRSNASYSNSSVSMSSTPRKRSGVSSRCSSDSFVSISHSQRRQERSSTTYSGDLLDRYYTAAQRQRKKHCKQNVEVETQTDVISVPNTDKASERKVMTEQRKMTVKTEDKIYNMDEPERGIAAFPYSFLREASLYAEQPSARMNIEAVEEDDHLYLTFIEDVTNEILNIGLFSNRVLEQLFECHIEEYKNRLDESKMRHLLDVLKADLGCSPGSGAEQIRAGWEAFELLDLGKFNMMEQLEFSSRSRRQGKATRSEEFFKTLDLLLKEPSTCEVPLCSENSKKTESKGDFSEDIDEMMNAETESHVCVKSEDPDASPSCEETLNLITCDSDLEANKELDDLEENFAEVLQIAHDHSL
ncbi:spermatogenesis-associated protein 7 isoform X4 [Gallus gallus]|uniref:spermatogenesis-associated protein 7 isoform X4 n=1 Tax=Gallus gallus TaxID=9031 RepID=UPI001AE4EBFF|nr:spermatogenesis-associated protein 7 isoform X4 [Gallus gallus]XP_040557500.1 spermatogenesis-associated protein 7 isoform X4 [Gallus gallus]